MNVQSFYRSPFAPRIHFDEAGAGGAAGAGAGDAGGGAGAGGGAAKPWYDGKVDADIIGHWDNKGWKKDDPVAVAIEASKAARELQKHFGVPPDQLLRLPKDASDEAGWSAVRQRLGAPKEAKDYDFSAIKFADGSDLDQGFVDRMRGALHRAGTPKDAAPEVVKEVVKFMSDAEAAEQAERATRGQAERNALKQEWGQNFDMNHLTAMQGAKRVLGNDEAAAKSVVDAMEQAMGYKATMEFWRKIGAGTTEATFVEGGRTGNPVTVNGAIARKNELMSDPAWAERYLKGSQKEVSEMNNLLALIAGEAA